MNSSHVAGGPLGVARTDRQPRSRTRRPGRSRLPTVLNWAGQILLGAAIVEALAVGMFGLAAGTFFVLLFLAAYVATFAAARWWVR